jgi:hypothetical protein
MTEITVHIASSHWCIHCVVTATQIPVGPGLLFDSNDEIKAEEFTWGHVAEEELAQYEIDLRRWGTGSVRMQLTDRQLSALVARKRGWRRTHYGAPRPPRSASSVENQSRAQTWSWRYADALPAGPIVRRALASAKIPAKIVDARFTNTAARDFNGKLVYLDQAPASGYVGKQYCVIAPHSSGT